MLVCVDICSADADGVPAKAVDAASAHTAIAKILPKFFIIVTFERTR